MDRGSFRGIEGADLLLGLNWNWRADTEPAWVRPGDPLGHAGQLCCLYPSRASGLKSQCEFLSSWPATASMDVKLLVSP